ncbi:uncharacterized protein [Haliotis cracherodii]|uniref:uncharacterized protein n=1 Tax=Haliotis cracherodii TaxID=6455 RepID=UPI0039E8D6A7
MSSEFRPTSHHESCEIICTPDGQDILNENNHTEHESIDETKFTTDSNARTDHDNPASVEYHYIDDVNPASACQQVTEERQSKADDDYECIADTNTAYDYLEAINEPRTVTNLNLSVMKADYQKFPVTNVSSWKHHRRARQSRRRTRSLKMSKESGEEIIPTPEGQEMLQVNKPAEYESIDDKSTAGSYASTDHNNPGSVEYHSTDDVNQAPPDQQGTEESKSDSDDGYDCIADVNPVYDYIEAINEPRTMSMREAASGRIMIVGLIINLIAGAFSVFCKRRADREEACVSFRLATAVAAVCCVPLMIKYDLRKVAIAGSVGLICFCTLLTVSLATGIDVLIVPESIIGGTAYGLLGTAGFVGTILLLPGRLALAVFISYVGCVIGNIIGITISYKVDPYALWALPALGLLCCRFLSHYEKTRNITNILRHSSFYVTLIMRTSVSIGLAILPSLIKTVSIAETQYFLFLVLFGSQVMYMVILVMSVRFWRENLRNPSPTPLGMVVLMIGLGTLIHQVVPMNVWIVGVYMALLGIVLAYSHVMMPLVMLHATGTANCRLTIPVLRCCDEVGIILGVVILDRETFWTQNGALYFAGGILVVSGVGILLARGYLRRPPPLTDEALSIVG